MAGLWCPRARCTQQLKIIQRLMSHNVGCFNMNILEDADSPYHVCARAEGEREMKVANL